MKTFIKAIGTLGSTAGKILVDGGSELAGYTVRTADTVNKSENTYIKRVRESSVKAVYNHGYDRGYERAGVAADWVQDAANSTIESWDDLFSKDEETKVPDFMK